VDRVDISLGQENQYCAPSVDRIRQTGRPKPTVTVERISSKRSNKVPNTLSPIGRTSGKNRSTGQVKILGLTKSKSISTIGRPTQGSRSTEHYRVSLVILRHIIGRTHILIGRTNKQYSSNNLSSGRTTRLVRPETGNIKRKPTKFGITGRPPQGIVRPVLGRITNLH